MELLEQNVQRFIVNPLFLPRSNASNDKALPFQQLLQAGGVSHEPPLLPNHVLPRLRQRF